MEAQYAVWDYQVANAVLSIGKVGTATDCAVEVSLLVRNNGDVAGDGTVTDTIPAGWSVAAYTIDPDSETINDDGSMTVTWDVSLDAKGDTWATEDLSYIIEYDAGLDLGYLYLDPASVDYEDSVCSQTSASMPVGIFDLDLDCDGAVECPVEEICDDGIDNDHNGETDEDCESECY